jgi:hypothetical protein
MSGSQFGGRLILRDGSAEADLEIDIDDEWITLVQHGNVLGKYKFREVQFIRMTHNRVRMDFAGEAADFYPLRPDDFVETMLAAETG